MTAPISASWTRIENWLARNAPSTYAALAPPADPADIAATERVIGQPLPKPLAMSLSRHDGLLDRRHVLLPGFYSLLSARGIAADWQFRAPYYDKRTADEEGEEAECDFMKIGSSVLYGHPQLIPVGRDLGGGGLVLDNRPGINRGRIHEVEATEGVTFGSHEMWTSLPVLMDAVATSLETDQPLDGYAPVVDVEQRLQWDFRPLRRDRTQPGARA